ncbi:MAG: hypothetical protein LBT90_03380 [Holosporaceae bacterium]|jgi:ribonuclease D|nr:hypothetical protein [Holosporaceae bacterium]
MLFIDSGAAAEQFKSTVLEEIAAAPEVDKFIAVDTEFIRERLEKPLLCLVQIATPLNVFIIDAIAVGVGCLRSMFASQCLLKVLHSARQDLEILHRYSVQVENFRDTQLQEMILSDNSYMNYQSMVSKYLNKNLDKDYVLSNWKNRPLTQEQLSYAASDVIYLRDVYKIQWMELLRLGRTDWLCDELSRLRPHSSSTETVPEESDQSSSMRHQLLEWRKQKAQECNVGEESLVSTRFINVVLKKGSKFIAKMKNSRQISDKNLLDFLQFAEALFEHTSTTVKVKRNEPLFYALKTLLEICARKNNVSPQIIAVSADLEGLLDKIQDWYPPEITPASAMMSQDLGDIKFLHGWRKEIFGNVVLEFLNGNIAIGASGSEAVVFKINDEKVVHESVNSWRW